MRVFCLIISFLMLGGLLSAAVSPILGIAEIDALNGMLGEAGLDSLSLAFEKDWDLSTQFKSASQMKVLQDPWAALEAIQKWQDLFGEAGTGQLSWKVIDALVSEAWQLSASESAYSELRDEYLAQLSPRASSPLDFLKACENAYHGLLPLHARAFSAINAVQRDSLLSFFFLACSESEDSQSYKDLISASGLPYLESIDLKQFAELFKLVDFGILREASMRWMALADAIRQVSAQISYSKTSQVIRDTPFGEMIIGSLANDHYIAASKSRPCLIIDPSGDDRYEADLYASFSHPFLLVIDLAGNDIWRNESSGGLFNARGGFCVSIDAGGDDIYQSGDFSFSSFLGTGIHIDMAGSDIYRSGTFSQAAALFGVYLLLDKEGNDSYAATSQAQALGSTFGAAALADLNGADAYQLGGKYFHAPLMPMDFRTLGQGMGFGFRPDYAGGLGILYDKQGNDRYLGGVYAQGVGYWYATGMLIDTGGNDVYNAVYYPQGSGIHLACGMLYDAEGDDSYYSRNGPGQGAGHDWAVGVFIDGAGNDAYSIPGGNGLGLTNSVGIFVDRSGDDRYERQEAQNYGSANYSRGTGGIGLFLDAGGKDAYPDTLRIDNKTWQKGVYGIGRDVDINTQAIVSDELSPADLAPPDSLACMDEIFAAAAEWEVGNAIQRVRAARKYMLDRKDEAIAWVLENKMSTQSGLEYRALEVLTRGAPEFVPLMYPLITGADSLAAKNALSLISSTGDSLVVDHIEKLLQDNKYVPACLSALGAINSQRGFRILVTWAQHPTERFRYIAARGMMQLKLPEAREALLGMANDPSYLVRTLVRNLPPQSQ